MLMSLYYYHILTPKWREQYKLGFMLKVTTGESLGIFPCASRVPRRCQDKPQMELLSHVFNSPRWLLI